MSAAYKQCPRCGTPAHLHAPWCGTCGHAYRTVFAGAPQLVPPAQPPAYPEVLGAQQPPPRRDSKLWLLLGLIPVLGVLCITLLLVGLARAPGTAPGSPPPSSNAGGAPLVLASGWREEPSEQERPEIRITDETPAEYAHPDSPSVLVFAAGSERYELRIDRKFNSISIPPGEYRYALYGMGYRATGKPDQAGSIICRRYRLYTLPLSVRALGSGTEYRDLGDDR